ncbi:MAG: MMPL family transporter, partial [Acidobacteriota bacterium]
MTRRWRTVALLTIVVAGFAVAGLLGLHAADLRIRVDEFELLPRASEVLDADRRIRETFGSDERFVIGVTSARREVTEPIFLGDLDFLVRQLHTSRNFGTLLHDRLGRARYRAEPVADAPWLLHAPDPSWIEQALEVSPLIRDLAVGASRHTAFLETPSLSGDGVASLQERLAEAVTALDQRRPGEYTVRVVGRDVVLNGLGMVIYDDLVRLLPWTFAVVFVLLWLAFRSIPLAVIALAEVGLAVLSTLGVLALLGLDLSIMTALVPVLVTVLGIADEIHLFGEFARWSGLSPEASRFESARRALAHVVFPITATTLTTAIGFASFLFTDVPALHAFGLLASLGVCFSWLYTVTVVPALLALVPVTLQARWAEPPPTRRRRWWLSRPAAVIVTLLTLPGWLGLRVDDGWTRNFRPDHPIVQDVDWFQRESVGLYAFDVVLGLPVGEAWTEPDALRTLDTWVGEMKAS